jgi:hypothetical protein
VAGRGRRPGREEPAAPAAPAADAPGSAIDEVVARAGGGTPESAGDLTPEPALRLAVLTCMDARIDPAALLCLAPGEAHVIRNAGGLAGRDALAALRLSRALGAREVMVIHHTGCGGLAARGIGDPAAAAGAEAARIRDAAPGSWSSVRGFVLHLGSGRLTEVLEPRRPRRRAGRG